MGWVIYKMYSKYMDALKSRGRVPYIHAVFDAIQRELQLEGKQLPECVWNDDIRYLTFGRRTKRRQEIAVGNDDDMKIEEEVEEVMEQPKSPNADIPKSEQIASELLEGNERQTTDVLHQSADDIIYDSDQLDVDIVVDDENEFEIIEFKEEGRADAMSQDLEMVKL